MNKNKFNLYNILNFLFACTAFLGLGPYFVWHSPPTVYRLFVATTFFIFLITSVLNIEKYDIRDYLLAFLYVFVLVVTYHSKTDGLLRSLVSGFLIFAFLIIRKENKTQSFKYFSIIFAISLVPGLLVYVCNLLGIPLTWSYLEPLNPSKTLLGHFYKRYLGSVVLTSSANAPIWPYRFCGMFDEPGVIGTITALLLIGNQFNLKKWYSKILFVGGILSLSFAFMIMVILYFMLVLVVKKNFKVLFVFIFVIGLFILFSPYMAKNSFVNNYIVERLTGITKWSSVDNRTVQGFDYEYSKFLSGNFSDIIFGRGVGSREGNPNLSGSTYKFIIYDSGILGFTALVLLFLAFVLRYPSLHGFIFFIIFFASVYQRPGVLNLPHILIFLGSALSPAAVENEVYRIRKKTKMS